MNLTLVDQTSLLAFWLVFTRWLVILFQLPHFDNMTIPAPVKALVTLIISYAFFPYLKSEVMKDIVYYGADQFW